MCDVRVSPNGAEAQSPGLPAWRATLGRRGKRSTTPTALWQRRTCHNPVGVVCAARELLPRSQHPDSVSCTPRPSGQSFPTAPKLARMQACHEPLVIAGRVFQSRLLVGTGKFSSPEVMRQALVASGTQLVTVALR